MALTRDALAHMCEQAEAAHIAEQVRAFARLRPEANAQVQPFAGGVAVLSAPEFGHKLNRVTAAGIGEPLTDAALAAVEQRFAERATALEIDLCPYADARSFAALAARGYAVDSFTDTYAIELDAAPPPELVSPPELAISELARSDAEAFVSASVAGFSAKAGARSPVLLEALVRIALLRPHTELFVARRAGAIAATAALALLDTRAGPVAHLFLASTLPAERGQGVQRALLAHRLQRARALGARLATVAARPGSTSARNTERAGLRLAYNKPTFRGPA
jgi:GNAT superfamily N-acetyltransferase